MTKHNIQSCRPQNLQTYRFGWQLVHETALTPPYENPIPQSILLVTQSAMGFVNFSIKAFIFVFVTVIIAIAIHSWLLYKSYIFSQESIADVTSKAIARAKSGAYLIVLKPTWCTYTLHVTQWGLMAILLARITND